MEMAFVIIVTIALIVIYKHNKKVGEKKAEKVCKGVNVNPLGLNAVARMGIGDFGLMARYSVTSLFLDDSPVQTYPFMLGISASF